MKYILIYAIRLYQMTIGIWFRGSCRFHPTCSEYMLQSIKKHGIKVGISKGIIRLSKCHPYSKEYGIDEV